MDDLGTSNMSKELSDKSTQENVPDLSSNSHLEDNISPEISLENELIENEVVEVTSQDSDNYREDLNKQLNDTSEAQFLTYENELSNIKEKKVELKQTLIQLEDSIENINAISEDLENWVAKRRKSYAWKLVNELDQKRAKLLQDEEKLKVFIDSKVSLDRDFVPRTRKWILRRIFGNFVPVGLILTFLSYLQRNKNEVLTWLSRPSDVEFIDTLKLFLYEILFQVNIPYLMLIVVLISFGYFIGTLFSYSRKVSSNDRLLQEEASKVRAYGNAIFEIRSARERIDALYPQVSQLLEVWSKLLHEPFKIDSKYTNFSADSITISDIPESIEFASPTQESIDRVFETLVLLTLNEIQSLGWREALLDESLKMVGSINGFGNSKSVTEELIEDHRRSGIRQIILNTEPAVLSRALHDLGDKKVQAIARIVQERILFNAHPMVKSLRIDPLSSLDISEDIGSPIDSQESTWESKLAEAAVASSNWSILNFSNEGQSQGKHLEEIESLFIASKNVVNSVNIGIPSYPLVEPGNKPFEVSIRADLSSWCKPGDLAIFEGLPSSESESVKIDETKQSKLDSLNDDLIY